MELWLILAIISAVFSGISSFILKAVAKNNESSELHVLYSSLFGLILLTPTALYVDGISSFSSFTIGLSVLSGLIASVSIIFKVYALRHIDTTIYFPLFKIVSPFFAIILGIVFFQETFTQLEWFGLLVSLIIPLLLITKTENKRQNNLRKGILLILFTGTLAALIAALNNYLSSTSTSVLWIGVFSAIGILIGSSTLMLIKHGSSEVKETIKTHTTKQALCWALIRGITINLSFVAFLYALTSNGTLGIVYTIVSMYILIPIVLAIVFYGEHWNFRKILAITLSVLALGLFL